MGLLHIMEEAIGLGLFSGISLLYMIIRGVIVYFVGVGLARFNKKLISIRTPFNFVLSVMLGSIFAQAIIDGALFLLILITITILVVLNGTMTMLSFYFPAMEHFMKGAPTIIVQDGQIQWQAMRKNFITKRELYNELGAQLHVQSLKEIDVAIVESDGSINFIKKLNE